MGEQATSGEGPAAALAQPWRRIPVLLCIDVEPEERRLDLAERRPWLGFADAVALATEVREGLAQATGAPVRFSWFYRMDPQIERCYGDAAWVVRHYAAFHEALHDVGDEQGLHLHAFRWREDERTWIVDHADPEWVEHCVRVGVRAFADATGRPCRVFRFGDRFLTTAMAELLAALGVCVDLTVEPGLPPDAFVPDMPCTGTLPDYRVAPRVPYRPSSHDVLEPDPARPTGLWILPMSSAPLAPGVAPGEPPWHRPSPAVDDGSAAWATLRLWHPPDEFQRVVARVLSELEWPYLATVVRTDMTADPALRAAIVANLEHLRTHPLAHRFVFTTPCEAMALLGHDPMALHDAPDLRARLRATEARLAAVSAERDWMTGSKSWRATAPLRAARRLAARAHEALSEAGRNLRPGATGGARRPPGSA